MLTGEQHDAPDRTVIHNHIVWGGSCQRFPGLEGIEAEPRLSDVDLMADERGFLRLRVADHRNLDAVEVRAALDEVVVVSFDDEGRTIEGHEAKGTSADKEVRRRGIHTRFDDVAGNDDGESLRQHLQERGLRAAQMYTHRRFIDRFARLVRREVLSDCTRLRIGHVVEREDDIIGGQRRSVMPRDALSKVKGELQAILRHFPVLGEIADDDVEPLLCGIDANELAEDLARVDQ